MQMDDLDFDVVVVGAGLGGLTAALFAARYGHRTLIIERSVMGGQILNVEQIPNFPGFPSGVSGYEIGPALHEQALNAGAEMITDEVTSLICDDERMTLVTSGARIGARAVVVATGSTLRELGVPGERDFVGRGVSHCATCDGPLFRGERVAVVGGGDSAFDEAVTLSSFASEVVILHRREELRAHAAVRARLRDHPSVHLRRNVTVQEVLGGDRVRGVLVRDAVSQEVSTLEVSGLFVYAGLVPNSAFVEAVLETDDVGHIVTDLWMATSAPGVFAAGDVRQHSAAQLVTACGDGATAAIAADRYLRRTR